MIDLLEFGSRLRVALLLAKEAAEETPDVGSMSADLVSIPTGPAYPIKRRSARIREAFGGGVIERESGVWRGYLLEPPGLGRASARLAACEAMAKALSQYGARVYYRRD